MQRLSLEQLNEKMDNLPPDVKMAYLSVDTDQIIFKIAKENKLTTAKTAVLADETGLFMLGITTPKNFTNNLITRMEIDKELAKKMSGEINEQIFKKIRASLKKIHRSNVETQTEEKKPSPSKTFSREESSSLSTSILPNTITPKRAFIEEPLVDIKKPPKHNIIEDIEEQTKKTIPVLPQIPKKEPTTKPTPESIQQKEVLPQEPVQAKEPTKEPLQVNTQKTEVPTNLPTKTPKNKEDKILEKRNTEVLRSPVSAPQTKYKNSDPYREPTN